MKSVKFQLTEREISALLHLATVSGMDCWFSIDRNGKIRDRENYNRRAGQKQAIKDIVDGASTYDIERIGHGDTLVILNLCARLIPNQHHVKHHGE